MMFIDNTHYISKVLLGALVKHFRFEKIMSKRVPDIYDIVMELKWRKREHEPETSN